MEGGSDCHAQQFEPLVQMSKFHSIFDGLRRVVVFLLGVLIILDGLLDETGNLIPELIIGMVMVGILPVENVINWHSGRRDTKHAVVD